MAKSIWVMVILTITIWTVPAQEPEFTYEDLLGEWEIVELFYVDEAAVYDSEYSGLFPIHFCTIQFFSDGTAVIIGKDGRETMVECSVRNGVFVLAYPEEGDFQYTANYQFRAADFSTIVFVLHDMFQAPRAGIMRRLTLAG